MTRCDCRLVTAGFTGGYFDYLFIDEAGHATEMELIVPIIGLMTNDQDNMMCGGLVLAGDPKQLGPIVRSTLASNLGYGEYYCRMSRGHSDSIVMV